MRDDGVPQFFRRDRPQPRVAERGAVKLHLPRWIHWGIHRVATSEMYHDSYADIRDKWSLQELDAAHIVLDAIEDAREQQRERERAASLHKA